MTSLTRVSRRWRVAIVAALLLVALAFHIGRSYWPHQRAAAPRTDSVSSDLVLSETGLTFALWLPYPHQNLRVLEDRLTHPESVLDSAEDLLEMASLRLPSFGPFRIPPAYEMAMATDRRGEKLAVAIQVYPIVRWLLRAAGVVAGNPWLTGGEVSVSGRQLRVVWRGGVWMALSKDLVLGEGIRQRIDPAPGLALLRLGEGIGPVPAGIFRLAMEGEELVAVSEPSSEGLDLFVGMPFRSSAAPLFWASKEADREGTRWRGVALLRSPPDRDDNLLRCVVFHHGGGERWPLPGERILKLADSEPELRVIGEWSLSAYDRGSIEVGGTLLPFLDELSKRGEPAVRDAAEIDLRGARAAAQEIGQVLERLPLLGRSEGRRWLALALFLDALREFEHLSIRIADSGKLQLRLSPSGPN